NFDTPGALAVLFEMVNRCNKLLEGDEELKPYILKYAFDAIKEMTNIFGLTFLKERATSISDLEIEAMIGTRLNFRKQKKYKEADEIRKDLAKNGIILEDTSEGTTWRRKL
ncbi:MAG: cysteine--tRNA ligase, partial [Candidatus Omnitrophica bacterium]|nr:cysteine--tRNA ligase [Candidatus Omnitrophota bacterium]